MSDQLIKDRQQLKKVASHLYSCMMETAWNWNGKPAEEVRSSYESLLEEVVAYQNLVSDGNKRSSTAAQTLLTNVKAIKGLNNEILTAVMKTTHYAVKTTSDLVEEEIKALEKNINGDISI